MSLIISIIIIVKNDRRLQNVLDKLQYLPTPYKTEIIVVDASLGKLNDIRKKFSSITWIKFKSKTNKKTTIPEQRNVGVKAAKGNIIVFIDSDCIPHKNWLLQLIKPIANGSEKIVAGKVILKDANSFHNIAKKNDLHKRYVDESPTMNLALSRDVYDTVGFYDESFRYGSDVDFAWRAIRAGFRIRALHNAIIYHDVGNKSNELRRMYVYGKARTKLYFKNRYRLKYFVGNELLIIFYPLYLIFLPVTFVFHYYPLIIIFPLVRYMHDDPLNMLLMKSFYGFGILKGIVLPE